MENANYAVGNKREGKEDEIKLANPVCIEKGDRVVYTIKIKNEANNKTPCFLPNEVNVWLNDVLPGNGKNIISIKKGNSELDYTQLNNEDRNTQKKCEFRWANNS